MELKKYKLADIAKIEISGVEGQSPPAFTVAISPMCFFSRFGQQKI